MDCSRSNRKKRGVLYWWFISIILASYFVIFIDTGAAWSGKALAGRGWLENSNKEDVAFDFTNGDGSPENPYQIMNVSELLLLSHAVSGDVINPGGAKYADLHYRLLADMDMSGVDWFPIGY
jgi:hypothetical protein